MTGQCDGMCDAGWTGVMCEKGKYFDIVYKFRALTLVKQYYLYDFNVRINQCMFYNRPT